MIDIKKNSFKKFIIFLVFCISILISCYTFISNADYNQKLDEYTESVNLIDKKDSDDAFNELKKKGNSDLKNLRTWFEEDCDKDEDFTLKLGQYVWKSIQGYPVNTPNDKVPMGSGYQSQVELFR